LPFLSVCRSFLAKTIIPTSGRQCSFFNYFLIQIQRTRLIKKIKAELIESDELIRNMSIYSCRKYSGAKLKEIGERFGISDAAVSQASRRLVLKAEKDQRLKEMLIRVDALMRHVRS
jgi:DNA-directed RNA polymerase specialized sigma subunit